MSCPMSQIVYISHPKPSPSPTNMALDPRQLSLTLLQNGNSCHTVAAKHTSATLLSEDFIPPSVTPSPGSIVGVQPSFHPKTKGPLSRKSPLEQLILLLNSRKLWI